MTVWCVGQYEFYWTVPHTSEKLSKSLMQCQSLHRGKKRLSLHACGGNPMNFFFKSCFLEICGSKEFLVFCKNKLISLGLQRNVLNLLLKCLDHFKFQSQKNKKTQLSLLSVLFFLSYWFYGCVEWQFGYGIYPPFFKGSNHGTHFPVSIIITGAEDVVMAFSRSETEDRRQ